MFDPAILTPANPSQPKAGRGVLAVAPQAAKAFAEEFGAAIKTANRPSRKNPSIQRVGSTAAQPDQVPEARPILKDRTGADRSSALMNPRNTGAAAPQSKTPRPQVDSKDSKEFQPEPTAQPESTAKRSSVEQRSATKQISELAQADVIGHPSEHEPQREEAAGVNNAATAPINPGATQAMDALVTLLTQGTLAPMSTPTTEATGGEPLDEAASPALGMVDDAASITTSPHNDATAAPHSAQAQLATTTEADPVASAHISTDAASGTPAAITAPGVDEAAQGAQHNASHELANASAQASGATVLPTTSAQSEPLGILAEAMANPVAPISDSPGQPAAFTAGDEVTAPQETDTAGAAIPAKADGRNAAASNATPEAIAPESASAEAADPNTNEGDQPLPQQSQPAQLAAAKADTSAPQPLISGVQAPGQATSMASPAASSQTQDQQATQPTQAPTLSPAQQLASAMGALRRRGDGSYLTEISLNPKELGQVRLQVHVAGNTVSLQATALDPATRALLQTGLDDLSQALGDAGFESGHLDVHQGDGQREGETPDDQPFLGFGTGGIETVAEDDLALPSTSSADYVTSTGIYTLA